jgi:hypothetical protein
MSMAAERYWWDRTELNRPAGSAVQEREDGNDERCDQDQPEQAADADAADDGGDHENHYEQPEHEMDPLSHASCVFVFSCPLSPKKGKENAKSDQPEGRSDLAKRT